MRRNTSKYKLTIKQVINKLHVLLAANRAVSDESIGKLKTHNVHSEILYDFGTTNNVSRDFSDMLILIPPSIRLQRHSLHLALQMTQQMLSL